MALDKVRNFPCHRIAGGIMAAWLEEISTITAKSQTTVFLSLSGMLLALIEAARSLFASTIREFL
jgi:type IV secretory pathway TrbF-like protein